MLKFGLTVYKNAIKNYYNYRVLNMDTLIFLGTIAAFFMAIF
jgi:cation transport ATPase